MLPAPDAQPEPAAGPGAGFDTVHRFDDRVDDYVRWRPGYPAALATWLAEKEGFVPPVDVVDLGCGTGKLAEVWLNAGHRVTGVDPNEHMRAASLSVLGDRAGFTAVDGTAEATGLPDACCDLVTAGQAFHWFDPRAAHAECRRILRPGGGVALVWNTRDTSQCAFLAAYERLLMNHAPEYKRLQQVQKGEPGEGRVSRFFAPAACRVSHFENLQVLDWEGVRGRALSASYVPREGPDNEALMAGLRKAYERHAVDGKVTLVYDSRMFFGRIA